MQEIYIPYEKLNHTYPCNLLWLQNAKQILKPFKILFNLHFPLNKKFHLEILQNIW